MYPLSRRVLIDRFDSKPFCIAQLEALGYQPGGLLLIVTERAAVRALFL